jgi:sulfide dehydrogenase cytochrome subunit
MKKLSSAWLGAGLLTAGVLAVALMQASNDSEQKVPPALMDKGQIAPKTVVTPPAAAVVAGEAMAHSCAACHGTQGRLGDESFMPLAGMPQAQFVGTMADFREDKRPSTLMGHVARGFNDVELAAMAVYFAAVKPLPEGVKQ